MNYSVVCPANSYCLSGSSFPIQCPVFSTSVLSSNSSSACLCNDGYYMNISNLKCVQCGYGTYAARGSVNQCIQCPPGSNYTLKGSFSISDCACLPGFAGDTSVVKSTSPISLLKTCNAAQCPTSSLTVFNGDGLAVNAVDGQISTIYNADISKSVNAWYNWWRIDFGTQRQMTNGRIWGQGGYTDRLKFFQVWIGNDPVFPGENRLVYVSSSLAVTEENFTCYDIGRYLYIARNEPSSFFTITEIDIS